MGETWKDVAGYEGFYQVSDLGNVRSVDHIETTKSGIKRKRSGKIRTIHKDKWGQMRVRLGREGHWRSHHVRKLVAEAFIPNPNSLPYVNHINGDKSDNRAANLEWRSNMDGSVPDSERRLHGIHYGMLHRCGFVGEHNKTNYKNYRDRGITVCDEWLEWDTFRDWALSHGYADNLTIDRIDNDGNYCPENCRWVSSAVNKRNTRRAYTVKCENAETGAVAFFPSLADACEIIGVDSSNVISCFKGKQIKAKGYFWTKVAD